MGKDILRVKTGQALCVKVRDKAGVGGRRGGDIRGESGPSRLVRSLSFMLNARKSPWKDLSLHRPMEVSSTMDLFYILC